MQAPIVITGVTGFIGGELLRYILKHHHQRDIIVVIRASRGLTGEQRLAALIEEWRRFFVIPVNVAERVRVLEIDLLQAHNVVIPDIDVFFHCAADTDMGLPLQPSRIANLFATQSALTLARRARSLNKFVHFSTAFVSGKNRGTILDNDLGVAFNNWYEFTKMEAELCVRASDLPYLILRPSIVVGNARNGYVRKLKVLYTVWRAWLTGRVPRAPIDGQSLVDCVPIDYVVAASWQLANNQGCVNDVVQLCAGRGALNPVDAFRISSQVFEMQPGKMVAPWVATLLATRFGKAIAGHELRQILAIFSVHLPYLGSRHRLFSDEKARNLLASSNLVCPPASSYCRTLFQFCRDTQWGKKGKILEE